ncbi:MAG TPA: nitrate reductase molybdenum cofactor assembly chaperone [Thiobacillaceae bacterium]|nr:nitrate reductase molybdenum cofactor assembly chaperone [Thiobacillaceae bacterium]
MFFYRILSKLLDYPDDELVSVLWEIRERAKFGGEFRPGEGRVVLDFIDRMEPLPLTEWQSSYVLTFDLTPEHALHLTHHLFGDDKNRGPALIDLTEFYKEYGLEIVTRAEGADEGVNELPDFLPLVLEFASQLHEGEAEMFLSQWAKVLNQLATNLEEAGSPYAPLVRLIGGRAQLIKAAA